MTRGAWKPSHPFRDLSLPPYTEIVAPGRWSELLGCSSAGASSPAGLAKSVVARNWATPAGLTPGWDRGSRSDTAPEVG